MFTENNTFYIIILIILIIIIYPKKKRENYKSKNNNNNTSLHPSKQLEMILKKIGDEGWKLQATEKVGTFLMFIFMKKKIKS